MKIGFIGLGHMGAAMAANLVKAVVMRSRYSTAATEKPVRSLSSVRTKR
jgi:3-hydroxyisobutyrate dehydrogenase-like beta-hydroxyacid dehydrogenase